MVDNLERFTPMAQSVLAMADEFAKWLKHTSIEPAHLWVGLWVVEGSASSLLRKLDITYPDVQQVLSTRVLNVVLYAAEKKSRRELTEASKAAIEYAVDQARSHHHTQIGTGHLLLGLLDLGGPAANELLDLFPISVHELTKRIEIAIDTCLIIGDKVPRLSYDDTSIVAKLKRLFGLSSPPVPTPPAAPTTSSTAPSPPISLTFLRDNVCDPNHIWLSMYAAEMFAALGDNVAKLECYALVLRACPPDSKNASILINRGISYLNRDDPASALVDLNRAIEIDANSEAAYANRGYAWMKLGRYENAILDETRAIELNPTNYKTLFNRAEIYRRNELFELALADFNAGLKLKPDELDALLYRGLVHQRLGNHLAAFEDFDAAQQVAPDDYRVPYFRAMTYRNAYEFEPAHRELDAALLLKPDDPQVLQFRAWTYGLQENYDRAIAEYSRLIELYPENYTLYAERAFILIELGEFESAMTDLHHAQEFKTDAGLSTEAWLLYKQGNYEKAIYTAAQSLSRQRTRGLRAYFITACAFDAQSNVTEALRYFKLALEHWHPLSRTDRNKDYRQVVAYIAKYEVATSDADSAADSATPQP